MSSENFILFMSSLLKKTFFDKTPLLSISNSKMLFFNNFFFRSLISAQHRTFPKLFATPTCKAGTTGHRKSFSDFRFAKRLICGLWAVLWPNYFWAGLYTQAVLNTIKFAIFLKLKDCQLSICSILLAKHVDFLRLF